MQGIRSINIHCNNVIFKKVDKIFLTKLLSINKKQTKETVYTTTSTTVHQDEIFAVYQGWIINDFSIDVDLQNFDINRLFINISDQITPTSIRTGMSVMTRLQDKAISHLNCDDYRNTYDKFIEIVNLQKYFNDSMTIFLNKHKNRVIKIVKSKNFNPTEESLNMFLRFIFIKSREHDKRPTAVDWELDNFRSFVIFINNISDERLEIFNPFPEKENELISYLQEKYNEIIESIETFEKDIIKIPQAIEEFKTMLHLIVDNKIDGLKGECGVCIRLNDFKLE